MKTASYKSGSMETPMESVYIRESMWKRGVQVDVYRPVLYENVVLKSGPLTFLYDKW